jgi:hypothetical protein
MCGRWKRLRRLEARRIDLAKDAFLALGYGPIILRFADTSRSMR